MAKCYSLQDRGGADDGNPGITVFSIGVRDLVHPGGLLLTTITRGVRDVASSALRQPGTTLIIVLTLAVGIGANTAIYTLLSVLYQPDVRAPDSDRLFYVQTGTAEQPSGGASYLDAIDYREATSELGKLGIQRLFGAVVGLPGQGDALGENRYSLGIATSSEYFDLHGASFALGRGLVTEDNRLDRPAVAVVGHAFWRRYLGGDMSILGQTIRVNNVPFEVVGVTARGFRPGVITMPIHVPVVYYDEILPQTVLGNREARLPGLRSADSVHTRVADLRYCADLGPTPPDPAPGARGAGLILTWR